MQCVEVSLTVEEEEQWDPEEATIDIDNLSESGEESEEHDLDDVCFYSDMENKDDEEDDNNDNDNTSGGKRKDGDDDDFGDDEDARQIAQWEHKIKSIRKNLTSDLVILQRMTHSPNRKNPYNKFDEWSAWKTNDVNEKVDELNVKIQQLKESVAAKESPARKRNAKPTKT
jgi:Mg2+ and Co2+ transporter CorA